MAIIWDENKVAADHFANESRLPDFYIADTDTPFG